MNKTVFYIVLFLTFNTNSQENLVYNGDFEMYDTCPDNLGQVERCLGWWKPSLATSDYFNSCSPTIGISVPYVIGVEFQQAHSGNGYCGFLGYSKIFPQNADPYLWVEYIESTLIQQMEKDKMYHISFWINLGNYSNVANRNIGIYLSQSPLSSINTLPFYEEPQIVCTNFITDTLNWKEISGYYKANGQEKFVTIGSFYNENIIDTLVIELNEPSFQSSFYIVDDVSIIDAEIEIPNVFTPNNDGINDGIDFSFLPKDIFIEIINRWGNKIFSSKDNIVWNNFDECSEGVYFYILKENNSNKKLKTGFIHLIAEK